MKIALLTRCVALALILALGAAAGCIRSQPKEYVARGQILTIVVSPVKKLEEVVYTNQGQSYAIAPRGEGTTLALVKVRVLNQTSTRVTLTLDQEAAVVTEIGGEEFYPLEPGERAVETSKPAPKDNPYGSHLWGQIQLDKGYEITGWFFFEVPRGSQFSTFRWEDVEGVWVRYPS